MAYMCEDCGVIFDEAVEKRHVERWGEELDPPTYHCPECGSEFYEKVEKCCICGEHHPIREMDGDVCEDCIEKIGERVRANIFRNMTDAEISVAKEKLELGDMFYA